MNNTIFAYKCAVLITLLVLLMAALILYGPIVTPPRYLVLADQQTWLGVPNAWNVLSNLVFIFVGAYALRNLHQNRILFNNPKEKLFYVIFFISVFFVGFLSGYYHWAPSNFPLMWDRLPIAIATMTFVSAIIGERINLPFARFMLWPLLILAAFSVVYWYLTIEQGREDLRLYTFILVFVPIILVPLILLMFKSPYTQVKYLWLALITFLLARIFEGFDLATYHFTGHIISGHTLKHLLLGLSCFLVYLYIRTRENKS